MERVRKLALMGQKRYIQQQQQQLRSKSFIE